MGDNQNNMNPQMGNDNMQMQQNQQMQYEQQYQMMNQQGIPNMNGLVNMNGIPTGNTNQMYQNQGMYGSNTNSLDALNMRLEVVLKQIKETKDKNEKKSLREQRDQLKQEIKEAEKAVKKGSGSDLSGQNTSGPDVVGISKSKKIKRFATIGIIVFAVIFVLVLIKTIVGKLDTSTGENYYDLILEASTLKQGTFNYTLDVTSSPVDGSSIPESEQLDTTDVEDVDYEEESSTEENGEEEANSDEEATSEDEESFDEEAEETGDAEEKSSKSLSAKTTDWSESSASANDYWKYPNYTVTVDAVVNSEAGQPLNGKATITIKLKNSNYSDVFTNILAVDDKFYVDLQQMRTWMANSNEAYLIKLANELPESNKYILATRDELEFRSNYAESGESNASIYGVDNAYTDFIMNFQFIISQLKSTLGNTGLSSQSDADILTINESEGSKKVYDALSYCFTNWGSLYDSKVSKLSSDGILDERQTQQANNEKDNVINAYLPMFELFSNKSAEDLNFTVSGRANRYNGTSIESNIEFGYTNNNINYDVNVGFNYAYSGEAVSEPSESTTNISELNNTLAIDDAFDGTWHYLNFLDYKTDNELEKVPSIIADDTLDELANYINSLGTYSYKLTKDNIKDFIKKYDSSAKTSNNDPNFDVYATIIDDFKSEMKNITKDESEQNSNKKGKKSKVKQYPTIKYKNGKVTYTAKVIVKESTKRIVAVDLKIDNNNTDAIKLKTTDFYIKTLDGSVYSANNLTLLRNNYSKFKKDAITKELKVNPKSKGDVKLYFALSKNQEYCDLYYDNDDNNMGVLIQY